jgi:hypothetical protein
MIISVGFILRILGAVYLYSSNLPFALTSDAANYYIPQTLDFMAGKIPYRDFASSYSILFFPLISIALIIWKSVGSVVVLMTLIDAVSVAAYLWFCHKEDIIIGWQIAFLYTFCPISLYWISAVGHNGIIIALSVIVSLILVHLRKNYLSGIAASLGFLCCKLLGIIFWPAIVFFAAPGKIKRAIPMAVAIGIPTAIMLVGINSLSPITNEFENYTSGNIWFVLSRFINGFFGSFAWDVLPLMAFAIAYLYVFKIYATGKYLYPNIHFNTGAAFVALTNLIFLILSKKSNTFYLTMTLLPLIHVLLLDPKKSGWKLTTLAYAGSITTIEMFLWHDPTFSENVLSSFKGWIFVSMELLLLGCYAFWIVECVKIIAQNKDFSKLNNMAPPEKIRFPKAYKKWLN